MEDDFENLIRKATLGDKPAQVELAIAYFKGDVTGYRDVKKCVYWLEKTAKNANPEELYSLADVLNELEIYDKAFYWYEKAAQRGHLLSQSMLAKYYYAGKFVEKNEKKCLELASKAFKNNELVEAPFILAYMYLEGNVVKNDVGRAYKFLVVAADNGNEVAREMKEKIEQEAQKLEISTNNDSIRQEENEIVKEEIIDERIYRYGSNEVVGTYDNGKIYKGCTNEVVGTSQGDKIFRGFSTTDVAGFYSNGRIYKGYSTEVAGTYNSGRVYRGYTTECVGTYNSEKEIPAIALLMLL